MILHNISYRCRFVLSCLKNCGKIVHAHLLHALNIINLYMTIHFHHTTAVNSLVLQSSSTSTGWYLVRWYLCWEAWDLENLCNIDLHKVLCAFENALQFLWLSSQRLPECYFRIESHLHESQTFHSSQPITFCLFIHLSTRRPSWRLIQRF